MVVCPCPFCPGCARRTRWARGRRHAPPAGTVGQGERGAKAAGRCPLCGEWGPPRAPPANALTSLANALSTRRRVVEAAKTTALVAAAAAAAAVESDSGSGSAAAAVWPPMAPPPPPSKPSQMHHCRDGPAAALGQPLSTTTRWRRPPSRRRACADCCRPVRGAMPASAHGRNARVRQGQGEGGGGTPRGAVCGGGGWRGSLGRHPPSPFSRARTHGATGGGGAVDRRRTLYQRRPARTSRSVRRPPQPSSLPPTRHPPNFTAIHHFHATTAPYDPAAPSSPPSLSL